MLSNKEIGWTTEFLLPIYHLLILDDHKSPSTTPVDNDVDIDIAPNNNMTNDDTSVRIVVENKDGSDSNNDGDE